MAGIAGSVASPYNRTRADRDSDIILSILIPVHNEGDQIAENLSLIHAEALKTGLPMEMIVIDDGSTDKTWPVLQGMVEQIPGLKACVSVAISGRRQPFAPGWPTHPGKRVS